MFLRKQGFFRCLLVLALAFYFVLSINSLLTFPDSYDDEGFYAAYGLGYTTTGQFSSPSIQSAGPFARGNAWNSRINAVLFGGLGKWFGHSLGTARSISFLLIGMSAFLWILISKQLGFSRLLGLLMFLTNERIFYASHVFRPESTLVFFNTLFVYFVVRFYRTKESSCFLGFRGVLNGMFVLAHGTGLVTAILNTTNVVLDWMKNRSGLVRRIVFYGTGSLAGIFLFYLIQIHDVGGWSVAQAQLVIFKQYQIKFSLWDSICSDLKLRWGTELVFVGGSLLAKVLRFYFYGLILFVSMDSVLRRQDLSRHLGLLSLGCVLSYMLIVPEKVDIQIAEMIPFFLATLIAWYVELQRHLFWKIIAKALIGGALLVGIVLCSHHALKYRHISQTQIKAASIQKYLDEVRQYPVSNEKTWTFVGKLNLWFYLKDQGQFFGARYFEEFLPLRGRIMAFDEVEKNLFFKQCSIEFEDTDKIFKVFLCH